MGTGRVYTVDGVCGGTGVRPVPSRNVRIKQRGKAGGNQRRSEGRSRHLSRNYAPACRKLPLAAKDVFLW